MLKPGGYLLFTMRDGLEETSPRFARFDADLHELEKAGKCEVSVISLELKSGSTPYSSRSKFCYLIKVRMAGSDVLVGYGF